MIWDMWRGNTTGSLTQETKWEEKRQRSHHHFKGMTLDQGPTSRECWCHPEDKTFDTGALWEDVPKSSAVICYSV